MSVQTDNSSLIRLGNVSEDNVDHADKHAVSQGVSGILDDRDDVCAVCSHANQITARTMRELDGVDGTGGTDDISDVRDRGTGGGTEVENLRAGLHVDVVETTEDTSGQLRTEGIPHAVLDLSSDGGLAVGTGLRGGFDGDSLLAVDGLAGGQVLGDEQIFLTTTGNENTSVTMGLLEREREKCQVSIG